MVESRDFQHSEIMNFLQNSDEMRKTAKNALKQSILSGAGALFGGLAFGPLGGLVGGVAGSIIGFIQSDDYDGAVVQLLKLEGEQRERLVNDVGDVLKAAGATAAEFESADAFRNALVNFASQEQVREKIWRACVDASSSE